MKNVGIEIESKGVLLIDDFGPSRFYPNPIAKKY